MLSSIFGGSSARPSPPPDAAEAQRHLEADDPSAGAYQPLPGAAASPSAKNGELGLPDIGAEMAPEARLLMVAPSPALQAVAAAPAAPTPRQSQPPEPQPAATPVPRPAPASAAAGSPTPAPEATPLLVPAPDGGLSPGQARAWRTAAEVAVCLTLVAPSLAWGGLNIARGVRQHGDPGASDRVVLGSLAIIWGGLGGIAVGLLLARPLAPLLGAAIERAWPWPRRSPRAPATAP